MIGKEITCVNATLYEGMLTRGKVYEVLQFDELKDCVKLVCDNGRTRLFKCSCFDFDGKPVPILTEWSFDDDPIKADSEDYLTWVEVSFKLSTGQRMWCKLNTPNGLQKCLSQPHINPTGVYIPHLIIVRSYNREDVDNMLKWLDENNELVGASIAYGDDE